MEQILFYDLHENDKIRFFDNDLILFRDTGGYPTKYENLLVIGGRFSHENGETRLSEILSLSKQNTKLFIKGLSSNEPFFLILGRKPILVFNRLFNSTGLGVVLVFDYSTGCAREALKCGMLDEVNIVAPTFDEIEVSNSSLDSEGAAAFAYSLLDCVKQLGHRAIDVRSDVFETVRAIGDITGCLFELVDININCNDVRYDPNALAALLLCFASLCRKISSQRSGKIRLNKENENLRLQIEFSTEGIKFGNEDLYCIDFCEDMANHLEIPLSISLNATECIIEFIPLRVDPSLCGLKASINISFED